MLLLNNDFNSKGFYDAISTFSELSIDVRYPSDSFQVIMEIIRRIKTQNIIKVKTHLFIDGPKNLSEKFGQIVNSGIHSITIESSVESIGKDVFSKCIELEEVTVHSSLISIGEYAFGECSSLKNVILPSTLQNIDITSFFKCTSLLKILVPEKINYLFYNFAKKLENGLGITKNEDEALRYYKIAAGNDNRNAFECVSKIDSINKE